MTSKVFFIPMFKKYYNDKPQASNPQAPTDNNGEGSTFFYLLLGDNSNEDAHGRGRVAHVRRGVAHGVMWG
jgi:hypothetical protein